jgi:trimeric autotransporter adhesin
MSVGRSARTGRLIHRVPAVTTTALVTTALVAAALAGGGQAAAAAHRDAATAPGAAAAPAGTISTVADGVGGPAQATRVALVRPCGVSFGAGQLYIANSSSVRAVDAGTGRLTTPAGDGAPGPVGIGGSARTASLETCGAAVDHSGNLVIAQGGLNNGARPVNRILQAMKAGHIYSVAGSGPGGFSGDGGPATSAALNEPARVAVDAAGNLVIADTLNNRIRVVAERPAPSTGRP